MNDFEDNFTHLEFYNIETLKPFSLGALFFRHLCKQFKTLLTPKGLFPYIKKFLLTPMSEKLVNSRQTYTNKRAKKNIGQADIQRRTGHACIWAMPGGPAGLK